MKLTIELVLQMLESFRDENFQKSYLYGNRLKIYVQSKKI